MPVTLPTTYKCPSCSLILYPPDAKNPHSDFIKNNVITCPKCHCKFKWKINKGFQMAKYGLIIAFPLVVGIVVSSFMIGRFEYLTLALIVAATISVLVALLGMCLMEFEIVDHDAAKLTIS